MAPPGTSGRLDFLFLGDNPHLRPGEHPNPRGDSGVDVPFPSHVTIPPGSLAKIDLGVRVVLRRARGGALGPPPGAEGGPAELFPAGEEFLPFMLVPRSSISRTGLALANSPGVIDRGYRGRLVAAVRNVTDEPVTARAGTALLQVVAPNLEPPDGWEVLGPGSGSRFPGGTDRGAGGFGSTGAGGSAGPAA